MLKKIMMHNIRIKYSISNCLKFISHADTTRLFFRLFRQLDLPLAYSKGFSPHPIASFSHPRSVGIISTGELLDLSLTKKIPLNELKLNFNNITPKGLRISSIKYLSKNDISLSKFSKAIYSVMITDHLKLSKKRINDFLKSTEIVIQKQKKDKVITFDIKPFIYNVKLDKNKLLMELKVGENTVPPLKLLEKLLPTQSTIPLPNITRKMFKK